MIAIDFSKQQELDTDLKTNFRPRGKYKNAFHF